VVAQAIADAPADELAAALRSVGSATVLAGGSPVEVTAEEVIITETPLEGWAVATDNGETVALDLTLTPALRRAGLARDVVRAVQEARKSAGLEVSDRIDLGWSADGELAEALREHSGLVADEVLALSFTEGRSAHGPEQTDAARHRDAETGLEFWFVRVNR
jgi:isoleucyl-tRNA synthetase